MGIGWGKTSPQLWVQVGELTLGQADSICDNGDVKATWDDDFRDPPRRVTPHFIEPIQLGVVADDHRCCRPRCIPGRTSGNGFELDESPEIVGPVALDRTGDGTGSSVICSQCQWPGAKAFVEIFEHFCRRMGGLDGIASFINPVIVTQSVDTARFRHELPGSDRARPRHSVRHKTTLDHADVDELWWHAVTL